MLTCLDIILGLNWSTSRHVAPCALTTLDIIGSTQAGHATRASAATLFCKLNEHYELVLQVGLAALKVPQSLEEGTNKEDPLHLDDFRALAAGLPFSKHVHSKLVCAITRAPMNEHNPPMVRRC